MATERPNELCTPDGVFSSELMTELESVIRLIRDHFPMENVAAHEAVALVRTVKGVCPESWNRFASLYGLEDWMCVALHNELADAVDELIENQKKLALQRDIDALTQIGNRGFFNRRFEAEVTRALRTRTEISILYLDLDNFKQVNDTYGHACGDLVLQRLARVLSTSIRHYDISARLGGEEFAVIFPSTSCWTALQLANRVLEDFRREMFSCNDTTFSMSFSGGVASLSQLSEDKKKPEQLLHCADVALYEAKNKGKNAIILAESEKRVKDQESLVLAQEKQFLFSLGLE